MNVDVGRKIGVQVMMTSRLLAAVDEIAAREAPEGEEPNRSKVIRRFVAEGVERTKKGGGHG